MFSPGAALLAAALAVPVVSSETPDLVLVGGKVFTADAARPWAEAVAVRGETVVAVGSDREIRALAGAGTKVFELRGRVVVPGLNDAHAHAPGLPLGRPLTFPRDAKAADVLAEIARHKDVPAGAWLEGSLPLPLLGDPALTREALDATTTSPVQLGLLGGHAALHNTAALRVLGIAEDAADPAGGWYGRRDGKLDGWLYEHALWRAEAGLAAARKDEELTEAMRAYAQQSLAWGVTSVQTMPLADLGRREAAIRAGAAPLRLRLMEFQLAGLASAPRHPVKYVLDGTPVERGAAMSSGYADQPGHRGRLNYTTEQIARMAKDAAAPGAPPLLVHVAGDAAASAILDAMLAVPADWPARRVRLEHADGLTRLEDARRLGVVVVQNPSHLMLPEMMDARFGKGAPAGYQPLRSLLEKGIHVALGSDGPSNPWLNVMFAAMHPRRPAEALTREQAVTAYTLGSAYAEFEETRKGSLAPGKLADLAVLSQDVFTVPPPELPKTTSVLTLVGGRVVHGSLDAPVKQETSR